MPLIEVLTLELGSAIAKSVLKLWLKDFGLAQDISLSISDIIKSQASDKLAQRRANRQFEVIGERVGESLLPIFQMEKANLNESSLIAVANTVAASLNGISISSRLLVERNLEHTVLAKYVIEANTDLTKLLSTGETGLYERIITEPCEYIVDIASQLPLFTERAFAEMLKREDQLITIATQVLQDVRRIREQLDTHENTAQFEIEYSRAIIRNLDTLELFGTDLATIHRRYHLSVAYVRLSVDQRAVRTSFKTKPSSTETQYRNIIAVDEALATSNRWFIRGLPGSGKTTLLQWIAVNSASKNFSGPLTPWNNKTPFYIRLRYCVRQGLPSPQAFPSLITSAISGTMPKQWVHKKLEAGRAIVLIDGLDEVPASMRGDVRIWLRNLVEIYSTSCFIITSRPHAAEADLLHWMNQNNFQEAELQPMELADIYTFIDHWHNAIAEELYEEEEKTEILSLAKHLKQNLEDDQSKRNLATSPLLCAMLCALHRERKQQVPSDRIELYEACCYLLIERRDKERKVDLVDYPALTYRQKRVLLEDLAYWLVRNDWSEVEKQKTEERFERMLKSMQGIPQGISGANISQLFLERTGIIREPVMDRIDFTHRTFQEFLAAKAALEEGDIGVLITNAHNNQWRDVVILASGLATLQVREQILRKLIARGDNNTQQRHQLHLLAVACLPTSVQLGQEVRALIENRLSQLVPPRNVTDAIALSAAGDLAVPHLARNEIYSAATRAACVHALSFVRSDSALETLKGYRQDKDTAVIDELFRAWDYFNRDKYAEHILSHVVHNKNNIQLTHLHTLEGFQYLTPLTSLTLSECQIKNLAPLAYLVQLTSLSLASCGGVRDLSPLASLSQLTLLELSSCHEIVDLSPLESLTHLIQLNLAYCRLVNDISPLTKLSNLKKLYLTGIHHKVVVPQSLSEHVTIIY